MQKYLIVLLVAAAGSQALEANGGKVNEKYIIPLKLPRIFDFLIDYTGYGSWVSQKGCLE